MTTIKQGSDGDDVKTLQAALRSLGFYLPPASIDGFFGSTTDASVREFQRAHGLDVDGIVGDATWTAVLDPSGKVIARALPPAVEQWRVWFIRTQENDADQFPVDRALRFAQIESGGNSCATGRIEGNHVMEAGLAQTYFDGPSSMVHGFTSSTLRALCACDGTSQHGGTCTDPAKAAHAAVAIADMRAHRTRARMKLTNAGVTLDESTPDFWCFVKLVHALPGMFSFLRPSGAQNWAAYRKWVESKTQAELAAIDAGTARYVGAFARVFKNVEDFANG